MMAFCFFLLVSLSNHQSRGTEPQTKNTRLVEPDPGTSLKQLQTESQKMSRKTRGLVESPSPGEILRRKKARDGSEFEAAESQLRPGSKARHAGSASRERTPTPGAMHRAENDTNSVANSAPLLKVFNF